MRVSFTFAEAELVKDEL